MMGELPANVGPWKSIGEVPHIFRDFIMRQAIYTLSLKALMGLHSQQEWKPRYSGPPPPYPPMWDISVGRWYPGWAQSWDKTFMMIGNPLLIWGKLWQICGVGTNYGKNLRQGTWKAKRLCQLAVRCRKRDPETNVVWLRCYQDPTEK